MIKYKISGTLLGWLIAIIVAGALVVLLTNCAEPYPDWPESPVVPPSACADCDSVPPPEHECTGKGKCPDWCSDCDTNNGIWVCDDCDTIPDNIQSYLKYRANVEGFHDKRFSGPYIMERSPFPFGTDTIVADIPDSLEVTTGDVMLIPITVSVEESRALVQEDGVVAFGFTIFYDPAIISLGNVDSLSNQLGTTSETFWYFDNPIYDGTFNDTYDCTEPCGFYRAAAASAYPMLGEGVMVYVPAVALVDGVTELQFIQDTMFNEGLPPGEWKPGGLTVDPSTTTPENDPVVLNGGTKLKRER